MNCAYEVPEMKIVFEKGYLPVPDELTDFLDIHPFWKNKQLAEKFKLDCSTDPSQKQMVPYVGE
jgi:hypothetical protein